VNASGAFYLGLVEPEWAGFFLHALNDRDIVYDVGANIGTYSVIAAGVCGARAIAVEPVQKTYDLLMDNISINRIHDKVIAIRAAVSGQEGQLRVTDDLDAANHVDTGPTGSGRVVEAVTLDRIMLKYQWQPTTLKIDVEGFETEVLRGASQVLDSPSLQSILVELRGHGARYGFNEWEIHCSLTDRGFTPVAYDPFARVFTSHPRKPGGLGDMLYLRDVPLMQGRVKSAPVRRLVNGSL
jgi:FkbM family methyltransferase